MTDVVGYQYAKRQGEGQKSKRFNNNFWLAASGGGGGGYSGAKLTGMIEGFRGFFLGRRILASIFLGNLISVRIVWVLYHLMLSGNFWGRGWGLNVGSVFFFFLGGGGGFFKPKEVLGFHFCPHSITPVTWNPEYPPTPPWGATSFFLQFSRI